MARRTVLALVLAVVAVAGTAAERAAAQGADGVTVGGRVIADASAPEVPIPDSVLLLSASSRGTFFRGVVVEDGTFAIEGVPPGRYSLQVSGGAHMQQLDVSTTDVVDLEVPFVAQWPVPTSLRVDDGSEPPRTLYVIVMPQGDRFAWLGNPVPMRLPRGLFHVFVRPPLGYHVLSAAAGATDLLREPLSMDPDHGPISIDVVLTRTPPVDAPRATLSGVLPQQPGVEVELVDRAMPGETRIAGTVRADDAGRFRFEGIAPGIYQIDLPPAEHVRRVVLPAGETTVEIDVPPGTIFAGAPVRVIDASGTPVGEWPATAPELVVERSGYAARFAVARDGFWGTLPPGEYRVRLDGLASGFSVRALAAGSVDLLEQQLVVPANRPAETIRIELQQQ